MVGLCGTDAEEAGSGGTASRPLVGAGESSYYFLVLAFDNHLSSFNMASAYSK